MILGVRRVFLLEAVTMTTRDQRWTLFLDAFLEEVCTCTINFPLLYNIGNFRGCKFSPDGSRGPQNRGCNILVSMPRNHTHHKLLHVKYRCVGVFNFRLDCSALKKRKNLHRDFVCLSIVIYVKINLQFAIKRMSHSKSDILCHNGSP